uniref:Uncharacterized protein n=1 Tax=Ananas comosus var. bracteatus TaxID=296719 RepID=A0A6V7NNF0_ANACO|nr:unnamed protein product [Ananas comosus var. bracteatus]
MLMEARSPPCFHFAFDVRTFKSMIGSVRVDLERDWEQGFSGEEEEEEEEEEEVRLRTLSSVDYETDEIEFSAYGEHDTAENIAGIWQMVPSPSTGRRSSPQETGTFSLLMREAAEELSRFIAAGKLHCKIDKVSDILETNRPDARNAFYRATIKQGDFFHLIWC